MRRIAFSRPWRRSRMSSTASANQSSAVRSTASADASSSGSPRTRSRSSSIAAGYWSRATWYSARLSPLGRRM